MTNKQKQNLLQFLGLYDGAIDGIWGPKSQEAMNTVREKYGEDCDTVALMGAVADWEPNVPDIIVGNKSFWNEMEFFSRYEFFHNCPLTNKTSGSPKS
jgi:carbohydrate-binding DOMON domain-containing protein